jgi:hypothetical protein
MRLFRRKTERATPAPFLVSLSPLQSTDNQQGVNVDDATSVGKSQSNDSIFKSSPTSSTRPQILHTNLKGTKNKNAEGNPKSPVKKGKFSKFSQFYMHEMKHVLHVTEDDFILKMRMGVVV